MVQDGVDEAAQRLRRRLAGGFLAVSRSTSLARPKNSPSAEPASMTSSVDSSSRSPGCREVWATVSSALTTAGIPTERIYLDKKSGATTDRPGLRVLLDYARPVT